MKLLAWWKEIAIAVLVLALGVIYHLWTVADDRVDFLEAQIKARQDRDELRLSANRKNKERTDAEYLAARGRAGTVVVRDEAPRIRAPRKIELAPGGDNGTICFERGRLLEAVTGWVQRDGARLAELSRAIRERSTDDARAGEDLAAAYRACRAWALNLQ